MTIRSCCGQILVISFFIFVLFSCLLSVSHGRVPVLPQKPGLPVRAAFLGGWLVTEGWMRPFLFDAIPNKDFLDGTKLQFKSVKSGTYLAAKNGGGSIIVANTATASTSETFKLWRINETMFNFRVFNNQFVGLDKASNDSTNLVATEINPGPLETFQIIRKSSDLNRVRIKAPNGLFLQVKAEELVTADFNGNSTWEDEDPSVFEFSIPVKPPLRGEFQLTNGYGSLKAPQVMKQHWSSFIVEKDFEFMAKNGLNAARIPVGWWIASDPNPPKPFVGGSLEYLDKAFSWAEKYGILVVINLHCAPGSQNGWEHSGTRDGSQEWGLTHDSIQQTVAVIDFLSARYAKSPNLLAVELINEPLSPGVSLEIITAYYKAGYEAVRKHTSSAYVILSNRLGAPNSTELFPLASGFTKPVIDVHLYSIFDGRLNSFTVEQHIEFVRVNRSAELAALTAANGPLVFVGEWVAEWQIPNASKEDYQRFAAVQLQVFGRATFGWAYSSLLVKNDPKFNRQMWNLEWMINNGYIKLN